MRRQPDPYAHFLTPASEIEQRVAALQEKMRSAGLAGAIVRQPTDMLYLAGTVQNGYLWVPQGGDPVLFVLRSLERARDESPLADIRGRDRIRDLAGILDACGDAPIGLEMDVLPVADYRRLSSMRAGGTFEDATPLLQEQRAVKSPLELVWMREAGRLHAEVFSRIPGWIREGTTELELSARIEHALRVRGHQGLVQVRRWNLSLFYGPVVSGPSACHPSCFDGPVGAQGLYPAVPQGAGRRELRRGEPILIDLVFGYNGYFVDKARTYCLGRPDTAYREAHDLCRRIQEATRRGLVPGRNCSALYDEILATFSAELEAHPGFMGCGENRVRFLGHGVGLELDEWPVLAPGFDRPLEAGMTVAVEPKIFLPGKGPVGVENTFQVTESGGESLTPFPDDLVIVE